jgi:hypothetical protein
MNRDTLSYVVLAILAAILTVALSGCTSRRQAAADAVAGIAVLRTEQPASVREPVADAAITLTAAAAGTTPDRLPPPTLTPAAIVTAPASYAALASSVGSTTGWWIAAGGWALAAAGLLAGAVRVSGLGGPVVAMIASVVEGAAAKRERARQADLAGAAKTMIDVVDAVNLPVVKKAISKNLTPEQEAAVRTYMADKVQIPQQAYP